MTSLLLSAHVLVAILAIGSITVAASMFPRFARQAASDDPDGRAAGSAALLHRICRGYAFAGLAVPAFGFAVGSRLGALTDPWLIASVILTAIAAAILALAILPGQQRLLALTEGPDAAEEPDADADPAAVSGESAASGRAGVSAAASRLAMVTGIFNVLWAVVVVLMIVRPGSTTGT